MGQSQDLYIKAKKLIPGGTQLLSKRPEMFLPELWPAYYSKSKGCQVWDLDGNKYTDMSYMGIGSCILGYADNEVNSAVKQCIDNGNMSTLNAPEEVELAELLCNIHPWADQVRFAKTGGESMAVAVRIARAKTGKDIVLFCGYHGWQDWYLAANLADNKALDNHLLPGLSSLGVPRGLKGTAFPFKYNDIKGFLKLYEEHKEHIAAIIMEPLRNIYPTQDFIDIIHKTTKENDIVLIVDEITSAWRLNFGGAHLKFGIEPDIAVFGKALSNGYPIGAIIGKKKIMRAAQDTFISSTYWTDKIGFVASLATLNKLKRESVDIHLQYIGKLVQDGWSTSAKLYNLNISVSGIYPLGHFDFKHEYALVLKTLFTKLMLEKGFLATTSFYASFIHKENDVRSYLKAVDEVFQILASHIANKTLQQQLTTPLAHTGFSRLT